MPQRRLPATDTSPQHEDDGLFKSGTVEISMELIPQMRANSRGDLVVRGFVQKHYEIEVLFAGRRRKEAAPLETKLSHLLEKERERVAGNIDIDRVRYPVRVEGAWRRRSVRDETDWETHIYQFLVARWAILDTYGTPVPYGVAPAIGSSLED